MAQIIQASPIATVDQLRAEKCMEEVQKILRTYNCQILPQIVIVGSQIVNSGFVIAAQTSAPRDLKGETGKK